MLARVYDLPVRPRYLFFIILQISLLMFLAPRYVADL